MKTRNSSGYGPQNSGKDRHGVVLASRLMDNLLAPHAAYAVAYIDDIIIFTPSWEQHLKALIAVLGELRTAGLTANPKKYRCIRLCPGSGITPEMWTRRVPYCFHQPKTQPYGDQGRRSSLTDIHPDGEWTGRWSPVEHHAKQLSTRTLC
ncbi:hypothetical protein Y1Q_0018205 [Alligator mississippiensis]|uniref:ribonuclease H n=1 Tax=Alligator mississippiensis TaxID=8496 RepID=A0A151MRE7_ALLMI|nr:hypothetical protein Y1Q_0018205 [Alligator mississippiensis]